MRRTVAALLLCTLLVSYAAADTPETPDSVLDALQDRQYDRAIAAIDRALKDEKAPAAYLEYLKGRALFLADRLDDATAQYDRVAQQFPQSEWARRARFARGVAFARKGDFSKAEQIYRAEAEFLLSADRKQEIADIYLEFADSFYEPKSAEVKPDYGKAFTYFQMALKVGPRPETRVQLELKSARCKQHLAEHDEAIKRYESFLAEHVDHPLAVEARFQLGASYLAAGNPVQARRTWEDLLEIHGESAGEKHAQRVAEAMYQLAATHGMPQPQSAEQLSLGVAALQRFLQAHPDHELTGKAHLQIGQGYSHRGQFEDAVQALKTFLDDARYADDEAIPDARFLLGNAYKVQRKFDQALASWQEFLVKHPTHASWSQAQREILDTEYLKAQAAFEAKKYAEARTLWSAFLAAHPLDGRNRSILLRLGSMEFDQERWDAAIQAWRDLVARYPGTEEAGEAKFLIGATLEEKLLKFEDALKEYRELTWSNAAAKAQARIAALTYKTMEIRTDRVFRSNDTPEISLTARNLEKLTVNVYAVDMETYFRKMHLSTGVERLDISLIDPDANFTFEVPDYEPYRLFKSSIPLPKDLKGSVFAVTVSSPTHEATTLIIRSDLDVIVKSSRDEVFVFAENMRTGRPLKDVRLLISDGSEVFAEAKTGDDGTYRGVFKELESPQDIRVFAVHNEQVASNVVDLKDVGVAQGLENRGYLFTDRPAYRPGQLVHIRGLVRHVEDDRFVVRPKQEYTLEVLDSRNRLLFDQDIELNEFGGFHSHFQLPAAATMGDYRLQIRDEDSEMYAGTFKVHQDRIEPVLISIDSQRNVFYRGEEIKGTIKASYYYGAPLVGREIRYRLADGRIYSATTNDQGEVSFTLPTRDLQESATVPVWAFLPEFNLQTIHNVQLAKQAFSLAVSTQRAVYLNGETFDVTLEAKDAEGKPIQRELELQVLKRTNVDGRVGEVQQQTLAAKTDSAGKARVTVQVDEGGEYVLRAQGRDRFENVILAQHTVTISDDSDTTRLRILADRHHYQLGEQATIRLHWREKPALALVTFQGARILDYQLVKLKTGVNELPIEMQEALAPNFDLAVSVMVDPEVDSANEDPTQRQVLRFHEAFSQFTVERQLNIELSWTPTAKSALPGEDIEVQIVTRDPQGNPVSAEIAVVMVEQALLDRFSWSQEPIEQRFRGRQRQSAMRTTSSISFQYTPTTQAIDAALLAEAERLTTLALDEVRVVQLRDGLSSSIQPDTTRWSALTANGVMRNAYPALAATSDQPSQAGITTGTVRLGGQLQQLEAESELAFDVDAADDQAQRFSFFLGFDRSGGEVQLGERDLKRLADVQYEHAFGLQVLGSDGSMQVINTNKLSSSEALRRFRAVQDSGGSLLPQLPPSETGYWNPAIVTDQNGQATVTITLPDKSTGWKLLAQGITRETLAGHAETEFQAQKSLFGELRAPRTAVDGDQAKVRATVHNNEPGSGSLKVTLTTRIGTHTSSDVKTIDFQGPGEHHLDFVIPLKLPADHDRGGPDAEVEFALRIERGEQVDEIRQAARLLPDGLPTYSIRGGVASSDAVAAVDPIANAQADSRRLQIVVGPTMEQSLIDAVFGSPTWCQLDALRNGPAADSSAANLMAALALQPLLKTTRDANHPLAQSVDSEVRAALASLSAQQNDDGGWSWAGRAQQSDPYHSARVVWALSLARNAGYAVPREMFDKAVTYLQQQTAAAPVADFESKVVFLHALTEAGKPDFTLANQLYRNRQSLSRPALAHLVLTYQSMSRKPIAAELLRLLEQRAADQGQRALAWNSSETEYRALYAAALEAVAPEDAKLAAAMQWLLSHRTGHRWSPDKATGPAMLALCRWYGRSRFENEKYELTVFVNNRELETLEFDADALTRTLDVPAEFLVDGKQEVRFVMNGRGKFTYQCVLGGFVASDQLKGSTSDWHVARYFEPSPLEVDGRDIPRGFDILRGRYSTFRNQLTQLPVGKRGIVDLRVWRDSRVLNANTGEQLPYLVLSEPLAAGCTVVENSVTGPFERFEIGPDRITFYLGTRSSIGTIRYEIHGYLPGQYQVLPSVVRDAYRPDQMAVAKAHQLTLPPLGDRSTDEYRLTPVELFHLGQRHYQRKEYQQAGSHLRDLLQDWNLNQDFYAKTVQMMLDVSLELNEPADVVKYFEIIISKYPDQEISFSQLLKVGQAYRGLGEYERAYMVYRAAVEASFMRESQVAGFLRDQGEFQRSVQVMGNLLLQYPPEPYSAMAEYALAQEVYGKAAEADQDEKLRQAKITRVVLIGDAWQRLNHFLANYPQDPAADEASFSAANTLLDLEMYEKAIERCQRFEQRYPKSDFLDSFWYIMGYCHFARGEHDPALELCRKVAESKQVDPQSGRETDSKNKWRAIYILGQIYHSLGQAENAIREYSRVKDRFVDALQAIQYFARKDIALPEVTTVRPGDQAQVELTFRNVPSCDTTVYRIDLMKFSLLRRSLGGITKINLAGIRPFFEQQVKLGDGKDYRDRDHDLKLPLKDEGAYLVVCRAENLFTSGLVLVTPLKLEVQEEQVSGRVRATVRNSQNDAFVHDVHVKVIGSRNQDFTSGETDLRGVFVADGVQGKSMVIAQADDGRYAFHRGLLELGPAPQPQSAARQQGQAGAPMDLDGDGQVTDAELLEDLRGENMKIQVKNRSQLDNYYKNSIDAGIGGGFGGGIIK